MSNNEYLNEERYQKSKRALLATSLIFAVAGLLIGGGLIVGGILKQSSASQIDTSMPTYSASTNYDDALNQFDESAKQSNARMDRVAKKNNEEFAAFGMIGGGAFALFTFLGIAGALFVTAKRREIMAFQAQQVAPLAKEGIEKATPVMGKAAGSIAKEISKGIQEGKAESAKGEEEPKK